MIICSNISKKIGSFFLSQLSFEIPDGYICGLVGQNGSGKTTLLHLLLGLYKADEGEILIDNHSYNNGEKEIRNSIGTVLVDELFDSGMSVLQNGSYYGRFYANYQPEEYRKNLELFHIPEKARFSHLSKGEKLKCQFAFALACKPKYLILDEPTANFDPEFRETFWKLLKDFVANGDRSVLLATHLTDDLDRMADYLIYMEHGKIIYSGDIEHFRDCYRIVSGEAYKLKLIRKESLIALEEKPYGAKALVKHSRLSSYDDAISVTYPSIEEFMYYYSKKK